MIGQRLGSLLLPLVGSALGSSADDEGSSGGAPPSTWTTDSSGKVTPVSSAEWSAFIAAKVAGMPTPDSLHLCQEASGNLLDAIGSVTLTAGGTTHSYQQLVAGWGRKAVKLTDGTSGYFSSATPSPYSTSIFQFAYVSFPVAPNANRVVMGPNPNGSATGGLYVGHTTTGTILGRCDANSATGTGAYSSGVHPVAIKYDRTNSVCVIYTDLEKLPITFKLLTGTEAGLGFGNTTGGASTPGDGYLYEFELTGAHAEAMTDSVTRALFIGLGYAVGW